ncbi:hypothetical protein C8R44DRAFT_862271 [Mycena epipterygia]|nr:hypothetical protein C8R44DRAFT_862271 [Mycena epipterygia]
MRPAICTGDEKKQVNAEEYFTFGGSAGKSATQSRAIVQRTQGGRMWTDAGARPSDEGDGRFTAAARRSIDAVRGDRLHAPHAKPWSFIRRWGQIGSNPASYRQVYLYRQTVGRRRERGADHSQMQRRRDIAVRMAGQADGMPRTYVRDGRGWKANDSAVMRQSSMGDISRAGGESMTQDLCRGARVASDTNGLKRVLAASTEEPQQGRRNWTWKNGKRNRPASSAAQSDHHLLCTDGADAALLLLIWLPPLPGNMSALAHLIHSCRSNSCLGARLLPIRIQSVKYSFDSSSSQPMKVDLDRPGSAARVCEHCHAEQKMLLRLEPSIDSVASLKSRRFKIHRISMGASGLANWRIPRALARGMSNLTSAVRGVFLDISSVNERQRSAANRSVPKLASIAGQSARPYNPPTRRTSIFMDVMWKEDGFGDRGEISMCEAWQATNDTREDAERHITPQDKFEAARIGIVGPRRGHVFAWRATGGVDAKVTKRMAIVQSCHMGLGERSVQKMHPTAWQPLPADEAACADIRGVGGEGDSVDSQVHEFLGKLPHR